MKNKALITVNILSLVIAAAAVYILPDTIPVHYGVSGAADRFGSKYEVYLFPAVIIILSVMFIPMKRYAEKRKNLSPDEKSRTYSENNAKIMYLTVTAVCAMMTALEFAFAANGYKGIGYSDAEPDDILFTVICIAMGALFIFIGNIMPKMKMNGLMGLRTSWSMKNEEVWTRCQRMGGNVMFFGGAALILTGFILHGYAVFAGMMIISAVILAVSIIGSHRIYNDWENENKSHG